MYINIYIYIYIYTYTYIYIYITHIHSTCISFYIILRKQRNQHGDGRRQPLVASSVVGRRGGSGGSLRVGDGATDRDGAATVDLVAARRLTLSSRWRGSTRRAATHRSATTPLQRRPIFSVILVLINPGEIQLIFIFFLAYSKAKLFDIATIPALDAV